jgi:hypothetical protein
MGQEQLLPVGRAHHFDGGLIAIHEHLLARVEQKNRVRAAFEQQSKHGLIVPDLRVRRTGPFVPL